MSAIRYRRQSTDFLNDGLFLGIYFTMGKMSKKASYLYCFLLIIISICIIAKTEIVSRFILTDIRDSLIPLLSSEDEIEYNALGTVFPILGMYEGEPEEFFTASGDYQEYVLDAGIISDNTADAAVYATATDAELYAQDTALDASGEAEVAETLGLPATEGITYSMEQLQNLDFLVSNCYTIASSTSINPDELNAATLLGMDMHVDLSGEDYKVLIYHTHGSEAYADSREGVTEDTVIGVGDELTRILEEDYGVHVYHDRTVYDRVDGVADTNYAYELSAQGIDAILAQYPSIEVIIDVHRDGVKEDVRLVENVNGQPTAQLMFVNGISRLNKHGDVEYLYNPYIQQNLAFSMQLHLAGKSMYGNLFRKNYISGYRYNMHKMPKGALVEVGAQTNTVAEAKNAMGPLAATIYQVLSNE